MKKSVKLNQQQNKNHKLLTCNKNQLIKNYNNLIHGWMISAKNIKKFKQLIYKLKRLLLKFNHIKVQYST